MLIFLATAAALQPAQQPLAKAIAKSAATAALAALAVAPAIAADKRSIGAISGSGFVFKDRLIVDAFEDPKIEGVTIYLSDFERPVTERLSKNFFSDPSQAGLSCVRRSKPLVVGDLSKSSEGEEIVSEARSLLFKSLRVRRIYDQEANTAVYVAYSTRLNKDDDANKARFSSSLCAISLDS
ncbi:hypothetical protein CTAYLR_002391 [Chrysophaeum taylorii]|uniref:Uncharacterized protein n=1 Tax=Chrysophaeum taylorii TaxID=2483200 RepID=A0AAD7UHS7_9STRA|nr:hypothetical protein CTAYLR_002391 [Chrysophaeum taylorii]